MAVNFFLNRHRFNLRIKIHVFRFKIIYIKIQQYGPMEIWIMIQKVLNTLGMSLKVNTWGGQSDEVVRIFTASVVTFAQTLLTYNISIFFT